MSEIIVEIDFQGTTLCVEKKSDNLYDIHLGDKTPHPNKDADGVMRALGNYLHSLDYKLGKVKKT